tara:strand:- start:5338 stop:8487 length:3150 start_codon:yes stop_codon:yes gene_type:complete
MRRALMLTIVLLLPLVQGLNAPQPMPADYGSEVVLESPSEEWTQAMWSALPENGYTPLRMVSQTEVLAWQSPASLVLDDYLIHDGLPAEFKLALNPYDGKGMRFVFEPRLPQSAVDSLVLAFAKLGISLDDDAQRYGSSIPHAVEATWPYNAFVPSDFSNIDGLLWTEPLLETRARNSQAASLHQHGYSTGHPAWDLGLGGHGIVVAAADSGIDLDHACFRNATAAGEFGSEGTNLSDGVVSPNLTHRKMVLVNHSIDNNDTPGQSDYRHGTHVAGTLSCYNVYDMRSDLLPSNGSALSYASKLVFQDIVSEDGWVPPDVDYLLLEAGLSGAVIHSDSWGDDTAAYTARSGDFDAWAREMPWSLSFIAPGNSGGQMLEPANGRNVAAIGAAVKSESSSRWSSSSIGPTFAETNGIFALAVGTSIQSARADGVTHSYNDGLRSSSGTSMATPAAASTAALVQQMVEQGWISGSEMRAPIPLEDIRPVWVSEERNATNHLVLSEGFTPSGPLLRSLLSLASTPLPEDERNGGSGGADLQNMYDGWGQLNLSELVDFQAVEQALWSGNHSPADSIWVHDSYRLLGETPEQWLAQRQGSQEPLENLLSNPWNGTGAVGPFLQSHDSWVQRFSLDSSGELNVRMSFPAAPEPHLVADMQLIVHLSNGLSAASGHYNNDGDSTMYYASVADFSNVSAHPPTNETLHAIRLSGDDLVDVEWVEVEVKARYLSPGNQNDSVGIDGDRIGFAVAVKGVDRDSDVWGDGDGDGIPNGADMCPGENASEWDVDADGCLDDSDNDAIVDPDDACPGENATGYDRDENGCIDDTDGDGVYDDVDLCVTAEISLQWPVDSFGCRPIDTLPSIDLLLMPEDGGEWYDTLHVEWRVDDSEGDRIDTGASIRVLNHSDASQSFIAATCERNEVVPGNFSCMWYIPSDLPVADIRDSPLQIEVYARSTNQSPEAKNELVMVLDDAVFTSNWNSEFLNSFNPPSAEEDTVPVRRGLLLFLGLLGTLSGIALMRVLRQSVNLDRKPNFVPSAFIDEGSKFSVTEGGENE